MPMSKTINQLGPDHYRYYATLDEDGVHVQCERFVVIGETECCWYVIRESMQHCAGRDWSAASPWLKKQRKRVLKYSSASSRRFCYPNKAHALESFKQRQKWRVAHANSSLAIAELSLSVVTPALENLALVAPQDRYKAGQNDYTRSLSWDLC